MYSIHAKTGHLTGLTKSLFLSEKNADIFFLLTDGDTTKRIPAHKLLLPESMVENLADAVEIHIKGVSYDGFISFLRMFYFDHVEISDPKENVGELMELASRYKVADWFKVCEQLFERYLPVDYACLGLELAHKFNRFVFMEKMQDKICRHPFILFNSDSFMYCDLKMLKLILQVKKLGRICPGAVFDACIEWATERCEKANLDPSCENLKKQLGECWNLIPYKKMESRDMLVCMKKYKGLFNEQELTALNNIIGVRKQKQARQ